MSAQWCWTVMWLVVLILVVWPLALIAAILFVVITPFSACCKCTDQLTEFLHKAMTLPLQISSLAVNGKIPDYLTDPELVKHQDEHKEKYHDAVIEQ